MNKNVKNAFTLAELMIVFTVIGVLTAILLPSAFHSTPDENILKFKKANNTLYQAIGELVANENYYKDGDLGTKPDGSIIYGSFANESGNTGTDDDVKYFCNTLSDVLSTKSVNCSTAKTAENDTPNTFVQIPSSSETLESWQVSLADGKLGFDTACANKEATVGAEIVTADGVEFYQANPAATFGVQWGGGKLFDTKDSNGLLDTYKVMCIDVDGYEAGGTTTCDNEKNICPFGYGVRIDGKIIPGARADEWIAKSIQKED